jgi:hypothetical protein
MSDPRPEPSPPYGILSVITPSVFLAPFVLVLLLVLGSPAAQGEDAIVKALLTIGAGSLFGALSIIGGMVGITLAILERERSRNRLRVGGYVLGGIAIALPIVALLGVLLSGLVR